MMDATKFTWHWCQDNAELVLDDGLMRLQQRPEQVWQDVTSRDAGVYLITHNDRPCYIGEAKHLRRRVRQQFAPRSTFYRSYNEGRDPALPAGLELLDFRVRHMSISVGRKDLEEHGIATLGLPLNKASGRMIQPRKRRLIDLPSMAWEAVQSNASILLSEGDQRILTVSKQEWKHARVPSGPGTYLVYDDDERLIYIGESSHIPRRYRNHSKGTRSSALRRHIGTDLLGLTFSRPMTFTRQDDEQVNRYIESCKLTSMLVLFGRRELEEHLIRKHAPLLNRKENMGGLRNQGT